MHGTRHRLVDLPGSDRDSNRRLGILVSDVRVANTVSKVCRAYIRKQEERQVKKA